MSVVAGTTTVRSATQADLPAIVALLETAGLPPEGVADCLGDCLLTLHGDEPVAAGAVQRCDDVVLLRSVVVAPAWRGRGLAAALVDALEQHAREAGFAEIWLLTDTAERWFAARGYRRRERADAPAGIRDHAQFRGLCPASAALMWRAT